MNSIAISIIGWHHKLLVLLLLCQYRHEVVVVLVSMSHHRRHRHTPSQSPWCELMGGRLLALISSEEHGCVVFS